MYTTLISAEQLLELQRQGVPRRVFDCSFELSQPSAGDALYAQSHIAGALRADLDRNLSAHGATDAASGGRHPLPRREAFADWVGRTGLATSMQAVVYDRQGSVYAGRLWWMLKWLGHSAVAVLDGGWSAWQSAGGAVESGAGPVLPVGPRYPLAASPYGLKTVHEVHQALGRPGQTLVDARGPARYRGDEEPLDPVAGHIPGALNRPFSDNLDAQGRFKSAAQLRDEFAALLAGRDPASVVHHCGSGVSAIPNLLAMELAGFGQTALFAGSWSEWCSDPCRPVARG